MCLRLRSVLLLLIFGCVALKMLGIPEGQCAGRSWWTWRIGDENERVPVKDYPPTKLSDVPGGAGKYIAVPNPSPQINEFSAGDCIRNVLSGDGSLIVLRCHGARIIRSRRHEPGLLIANPVVELVSLRIGGISDFAHRFDLDRRGRRITAVAPVHNESPTICPVRFEGPKLLEIAGEYECRFVSNEGLFREASLTVSNASQNNRENGNDQGGKSADSGIVGGDVITKAIPIDRENGNTLVKGLALLCVLAGVYTCLKVI